MESQSTPQTQIPSVTPTSPTPQTLISRPVPQVKSSLVFIMSILLLVTVAIASLFYFQIQKLSKELTKYQTQPSPTPIATTDPTASWKTYDDKYYGYTVKYPSDWIITLPTEGTGEVASFAEKEIALVIGKQPSKLEKNQTLKEFFLANQLEDNPEIISEKELKLGENTILRLILPITHGDSNFKYGIFYSLKKDGSVYFAELFTQDYTKNLELSDQILSTFKFLEASPSASPASN